MKKWFGFGLGMKTDSLKRLSKELYFIKNRLTILINQIINNIKLIEDWKLKKLEHMIRNKSKQKG